MPATLPNSDDPFAAKRAEIDAALAKFMEGADVYEQRGDLDDDTAERANDYIAGLKQLSREAEQARVAEKAPHLAAGKAVDASWDAIKSRISKLIDTVQPRLDRFLKEKQARQRREAEEAARKQREAEQAARDAAAAAAAADNASARIAAQEREESARRIADEEAARAQRLSAPVRVASATGLARTKSLTTERTPVLVSMAQALQHYKAEPELSALLLKFAARDLRGAPTLRGKKTIPQIPGIRWEEDQVLT